MAYFNNKLKNDHYVYILRDSNSLVRYVGEGRMNRVKQKSNRTKTYLEILNNSGSIEIVCKGLTKIEAQKMEEYFISKYVTTVINKQKSNFVKSIQFQKFNEIFVIDNNSISGLSWKNKFRNVKSLKAGTINSKGYYSVSYQGTLYKVHRIVWCLNNQIDLDTNLVVHHVDGNTSNNSPSNLQAVSQMENIHKKINLSKDSSLLGISVHSKRGKEKSRLSVTFYINDIRFSKEFSLNKYSYDTALSMALAWKESKIKDITYV